MALQAEANTADPLTFSEIRAEFASSNTSFYAYRKGAGIVDADDFAPNVVSTGTLQFTHFLGAARVTLAATLNQYDPLTYDIHLTRTHSDLFSGYSAAAVDIVLDANGTAYYRYEDASTPTTNFTSFTWKTGGGTNADYYAYMSTPTNDSIGSFGTAPNPALNTPHQLNTTRSWRIAVSSSGSAGNISWTVENATLSIRNASNTVLASRTLRMYVEATSDSIS
jgi:hypothetical protein